MRNVTRLFSLLTIFVVGCTPSPTFNVYITGEHVTWKKESEKSTLGQPFKIYLYPERGYEIVEDETYIQITNKHFPEGIMRQGMWTYSEKDSVLTLFGSMINCDTNVNIIPDFKTSYLNINLLGNNYETESVSQYPISLDHPDYYLDIEAKDGFEPPATITTYPSDLNYTYSKTAINRYQLKILNTNFYQDISITVGDAQPISK